MSADVRRQADPGPHADGELAEMLRRLDSLADEPISAHAAALDGVHRELVAQLDSVAAAGDPPAASGG